MHAIVIREPGGPERLEWAEVPTPEPGPGQALVRVRACGVCYRDIIDREGKYPFMRRPIVTGHELAGEITAVGPGASDFAVGDRVAATHRPPCGVCPACRRDDETMCSGSPVMYGLTVDGGYAEACLTWTASLVRVPPEVPLEQAAFLHCTAGVALRALRARAGLQAGETVVITGASGGVGIHAVQVAKILGARVIAVTSSPAKAEALTRAGADEVVAAEGFHRALVERTGGADVALELTGAPTFQSALRALRSGGRLVVVGNVTTQPVEVNPGYIILRQLAVLGSSSASRADLATIFSWVTEGRLRPVIAERLPLREAARAQERLRQKGVVGRIVLEP